MIWWHRIGQKVVCVDDTKMRVTYEDALIRKKGVYTIAAVFDGTTFGEPSVGFKLQEVRGRYLSERFQPVRDTSIESLRELLNPTPEQKRVVFQEMIEERQRELSEARGA